MKEIVVRKKILFPGAVSSSLCKYSQDELKTIVKNEKRNELLKNIFSEEHTYEELNNSYRNLLRDKIKSNDKFVVAYKIDEEFALFLDANIYLLHFFKEEVLSDVIPWCYADAKKYLGDTWWESDDEILRNIQKLSTIEFLRKYKGFLG